MDQKSSLGENKIFWPNENTAYQNLWDQVKAIQKKTGWGNTS